MIETRRRVVTAPELIGWEAIANAIDRSIATAKRMADRPKTKNPLPIGRWGGKPAARIADIRAWSEREFGAPLVS